MNKEMNRNEKFEWKKQIVREMTKQGAKVAEMAERLGMGEAEMYAFLSRNFGGVRKLRESLGMPRDIKQVKYVLAAESAQKEPRLMRVDTTVKKNIPLVSTPMVGVPSQEPKSQALSNFIQSQKEKFMDDFRESIKADMQTIAQEVKEEVVEKIKQEIMEELSAF